MKVRIAVSPPADQWDQPILPQFVDELERLGFDTVWLSDVPMGTQVDPLIGLAVAAGRTTRLKLGANLVPFGRNPMLMAKQLAQLDRFSAGRVLLSLVPGLDQPGERVALGIGDANRGRLLDETIPQLRAWWRGDQVDGITVSPTPAQDPLEIWLGGVGPMALQRAGRLSDGWLGAALTPAEARVAVDQIVQSAADACRTIDPEHFGLSIPYARSEPDERVMAALRARRPDASLQQIMPVGESALRELIEALVQQGLSKFVVRPVHTTVSWQDELQWLAQTVLPLQT
ncbi:MAG: putative oxidoreductase [Ilumatobacteraceae bacterium]|nr:putative oxidoreductase [Ilumatobacteraceae bacterium]